MAWNHPDDVPTSLTRRAYALRGVTISQNAYAAVVADAYEDVKREVLRDQEQEASRTMKLTRDNTDEVALWVGGWRAGGAYELVGWGTRGNVVYARPGDMIIRKDDGSYEIKKESEQ
jgi:hypothetical protein